MAYERMNWREWLILLTVALLFIVLSGFGIAHVPAPWWDEGWTLSVAKNWVLHGHYGHFVNGLPVGPALSAHPPVVAIIAASFTCFGVGLAQARMAIVVCAALVVVLLYLLSRRLFSRNAAWLSVVLVTVLPMQWDLSVFFLGRNVLGEIPALLFILLGLLLLLQGRGEQPGWLALAGISLGIALATKAQVVPFVVIALAMVSFQLFMHNKRQAAYLAGVFALALLTLFTINTVRRVVLAPSVAPANPILGLTDVTAMVFDGDIRFETLRFAMLSGAILTIALGSQALRTLRSFRPSAPCSWHDAVRSVLVLVAAGWYGWYVLLSIGWGRYGFPSFVIAAPIAADMVLRLLSVVRGRNGDGAGPLVRFAAGCLLVFFALSAGRQVWIGVPAMNTLEPSYGLEEVTDYMNRSTPPWATVETYDSEVLFLLDRPVHVPPAQVNVEFLRRNYLKGTNDLGYDLDSIRADFLLVGTFSRGVYAPLIERGTYLPERRFGIYEVYRRAAAVR
jgi:hypothetical protein